ncbi:MAG: hypothetical protein GAK28_01637 [Luteibacter sp.]|uniref:ECF-type sigma factor n=1 Tax=Luteibacter sp. TaxID=1886636 RepID=UPI00137E5D89|nr:ECF-type sigma factor [Luteibacter sp.]KAF1007680.1 MAG: hypothetical protein GAK28_01637 [Luteibacter sp.]
MPENDLDVLLGQIEAGDEQALQHAYAIVYQDLKACARRQLRRGGGSMNTTALVNETYIRIYNARLAPKDRSHLMGIFANAMRQVLVDHARTVGAQKRGGDVVKISLDATVSGHLIQQATEIVALSDALAELENVDAELARVVELRYFGGYSEREIAESLGVTERTVQRYWKKARAFLLVSLEG